MPTLDAFVAALIQEQDKFISMGSIRSTKDQALAANEGHKGNYKDKQKGKGKTAPDQKQEEFSEFTEESSNPKGKKKKEITKCSYCNIGFHSKESCLWKTIDEMARLLQQNNITVP